MKDMSKGPQCGPFFMKTNQILENVKRVNGIVIYDPIGKCEIIRVPTFLNKDDCKRLINLVAEKADKSIHLDFASGKANPHGAIRNSNTRVISPTCEYILEHLIRIADILCTPETHAEPVNLIHYDQGGYFEQHLDAYSEIHFAMAEYGSSDRLTDLISAGNRTWTAMIFLNENFSGGETVFPRLGINLIPREGDLICWKNTVDSNPILTSLHSGAKVTDGSKFVAVIPFRERPCSQEDPSYYI